MTVHLVSAGETFAGIAAVYGIPTAYLLSINGLRDRDIPVVGQALLILFPASYYSVQSGDTAFSVAQTAGVSLNRLYQLNPDITARALYPGETLVTALSRPNGPPLSVGGYAYPFINRELLLSWLPILTELTVFGYGFTLSGELIIPYDTWMLESAKRFDTRPILLLSNLDENDRFDNKRIEALLKSPSLQQSVLDNLIPVMQQKGYRGIDLDFEYIDPALAQQYLQFIQYVHERLQPLGLSVNVDLAPKTSADQSGLLYEAHNYPAIGASADTVFLMTYEWGYRYGPPMAVAPLDKVTQVLNYALSEIPSDKIILGIPNYAYDWPLPYEQGISQATTIGNQQAIEIAARNNAQISYDTVAASPYFYYTDPSGTEHTVRFEDVRSIQAKLHLAQQKGLNRVGYWNLMRPFAQNQALLSAMYSIEKRL